MNESEYPSMSGDSRQKYPIPDEIVIRIWNEITKNKKPSSENLMVYNVKVSTYDGSDDFIKSSRLARSQMAREVADRINGKFRVIDYVLKNHRVLGGSFHVFVDYKFEIIQIVSGV